MTDLTKAIAGKSLHEWEMLAQRDDCLDQMVPSDLRQILRALHRAHHDLSESTPASERDAAVAAARREERERCAKECDRIAGNTMDFNHYTRRAAGMCAAAIRAAIGGVE